MRMLPILSLVMFLQLILLPSPIAHAADQTTYTPSAGIPNSEFDAGKDVKIDGSTIAKFIAALYKFGWPLVGAMAVMVIIAAGFVRITAGGDSSRVEMSNEMLWAGITGLGIVLSAWVLLNTINPELVSLKSLTVTEIKSQGKGNVPTVELSESEDSPEARQQAASGKNAGAAGSNARTSLAGMPTANGKFLGYKDGVMGGSEGLKQRIEKLSIEFNDPTQNPDGLQFRVNSLADGKHGAIDPRLPAQGHYDNRAADIVFFDRNNNGLTWSANQAQIERGIQLMDRAGFNIINEYVKDSRDKTGVHAHGWFPVP